MAGVECDLFYPKDFTLTELEAEFGGGEPNPFVKGRAEIIDIFIAAPRGDLSNRERGGGEQTARELHSFLDQKFTDRAGKFAAKFEAQSAWIASCCAAKVADRDLLGKRRAHKFNGAPYHLVVAKTEIGFRVDGALTLLVEPQPENIVQKMLLVVKRARVRSVDESFVGTDIVEKSFFVFEKDLSRRQRKRKGAFGILSEFDKDERDGREYRTRKEDVVGEDRTVARLEDCFRTINVQAKASFL